MLCKSCCFLFLETRTAIQIIRKPNPIIPKSVACKPTGSIGHLVHPFLQGPEDQSFFTRLCCTCLNLRLGGSEFLVRLPPLTGNRFRLRLRLHCVRACERSCVGARCFRCGWAWSGAICRAGPAGRPAFGRSRWSRAKNTPLFFVRLLIAASRCFMLLPAAYRGLPLLPVAYRVRF